MSKTRDAITAKVQDVFVAAGRNCYAHELEACIDRFMQLPALQLAEKAETLNDEAEFNGAPRNYQVGVYFDGPEPDWQGQHGMKVMWDHGYRKVMGREGA